MEGPYESICRLVLPRNLGYSQHGLIVLSTQLAKTGFTHLIPDLLQPETSPLAYLPCFDKHPEGLAISSLYPVPGNRDANLKSHYLLLQETRLETRYVYKTSHVLD